MYYDAKESGTRIRELRVRHGYTQEEFAVALNIDRNNLSRIESGKRGCSLELLVQLSSRLNVTLDYLVLGRDESTLKTTDNKVQLKKNIEQLIQELEMFKAIL